MPDLTCVSPGQAQPAGPQRDPVDVVLTGAVPALLLLLVGGVSLFFIVLGEGAEDTQGHRWLGRLRLQH